MRLFLALEPDGLARARLSDALRDVQSHLGAALSSALRWSRSDTIHVTLHFLGEVAAERLTTVQQSLGQTIDLAPFAVVTGGLGAFPGSGPPRVLWIALDEGGDRISAIHAEVGRRLASAGIDVDPRPLAAHLTLARVRDPRNRDVRALRAALKHTRVDPIGWRVDQVTLFRSHPSPSGPPAYEALHRIELAGSR